MVTNILIAIVIIHLVAGFGWLIYALAPRKGEELIEIHGDDDEPIEGMD